VDIPVREARAYQRSIGEVPSSGCLKNPARRECCDTHSAQTLRTDYDGQDPRLGHREDELQQRPNTLRPPIPAKSDDGQRAMYDLGSAHFQTSERPAFLYCFLSLAVGYSTAITSMRPWARRERGFFKWWSSDDGMCRLFSRKGGQLI
jgi:hypothetical protein